MSYEIDHIYIRRADRKDHDKLKEYIIKCRSIFDKANLDKERKARRICIEMIPELLDIIEEFNEDQNKTDL